MIFVNISDSALRSMITNSGAKNSILTANIDDVTSKLCLITVISFTNTWEIYITAKRKYGYIKKAMWFLNIKKYRRVNRDTKANHSRKSNLSGEV